MNARAKNFIRGAGSIMDLAPARDLRQFAPRRSAAERMASHFTKVGVAVDRACGSFKENNGKTTTAKDKVAA